MAAHVLVPLKRLDNAKTRLAGLLTRDERAGLMEALLDNAIAAASAARGVAAVTVVSAEPLAAGRGVPVWDDRGLPWNDALLEATRALVREETVVFLSADIPLVVAADVDALLEATPERGIAVGRALDAGTNAVSLRPPGAMTTCFGEQGSAELHARLARAAGLAATIVDRPGLALDLDSPDDVERYLREAPGSPVKGLLQPIFERGKVNA